MFHLDAADGGEVVTVEVEQQALEQGLGCLQVGGFAGRMTR